MRKLFTILSAVAITFGLGVPAGAATRSSDRKPDPGHAKAQHGDKDRDRHVKDQDRHVKDRDHDGDHDRRVKHGDHDGDRDDRHFNDRDRDRDRDGDHDRDRDRRDFSDHHDHHYHYYHYYYPYYGDYDGGYYRDGYYRDRYYRDRYYYDRYSYGRYYDRRYDDGGSRGCDFGPPPDGIVVIRCLAFSPRQIHVGVGQDVVWWWQDGATPHTVTADDGSFDSGRRTDGNVRLTFNHPGQFTYHCRIHPDMAGSVVVG